MEKQYKKLRKMFAPIVFSRLNIWFVYPVLLLILWFILTLFFNPYSSFSTLIEGQVGGDLISGSSSELLLGQKISGKFIADDNYLGIVVFNFNVLDRTNNSSIVFKLKEEGSMRWNVVNTYKLDKFQNGRFYPFGFPVFPKSKNKTFIFEISSLDGEKGNAVKINYSYPFILKKYVVPHSAYTSNIFIFIIFLMEKIINSISYLYFIPIGLVYLLPLIIYFCFLFSLRIIFYLYPKFLKKFLENLRKRKYFMAPLVFVFMLINILFIEQTMDIINFELIITWLVVTFYYKLSSSISFFGALLLLLMMPFFLLLNAISLAEKAAIQIYYLLAAGVFFGVFEIKRKKKIVSLSEFFQRLING